MAYTVMIHLVNEDPILAEMEELPGPSDRSITCTNLRRRDGKEIHYITPEAISFIFPWHRISFIEVLPGGMERAEVVKFFRD
jgi:hypothetical protein